MRVFCDIVSLHRVHLEYTSNNINDRNIERTIDYFESLLIFVVVIRELFIYVMQVFYDICCAKCRCLSMIGYGLDSFIFGN